MLTFDFILGLTLHKIRQQEERRRREKSKRKAVFTNTGNIVVDEIIEVPRFRYKTVVFLSAQGLGRREVMFRLVRLHPQLYAFPTMYTSRPPKQGEADCTRYTFVTRRQMLHDIRDDRFLEHGTYKDHLYGIKMDTIRSIHRDGKMALVEISPMSLQHLRNPEFAPFVIFIAPPLLEGVLDCDGSITRINNESDQIRRDFAHVIDMTIVMNDMSETVTTLEVVLDDIVKSPQWVPTSWVYYRPPQCSCHH